MRPAQVIGVSTAFAEGAQGIFFAIPINIAKPIMRQAVAGEELSRPWIGIVYVAVDRNLADENDLPIDYGAWISPETADGAASRSSTDSPAQRGRLQAGRHHHRHRRQRIDASQGLDDILSLYEPGRQADARACCATAQTLSSRADARERGRPGSTSERDCARSRTPAYSSTPSIGTPGFLTVHSDRFDAVESGQDVGRDGLGDRLEQVVAAAPRPALGRSRIRRCS